MMVRPAAPRAALLLSALALMAGCGSAPAPSEGRPTMTTTPAASPAGDARSYQARTLEILGQVYAQLGTQDKPPLEDQKAPGGEAVCGLDETDPTQAWVERVYLPVDSPEDEGARARAWLADEGYEQTSSRQDGTITTHRAEGFTVTVGEWSDGRVQLTVESPCAEG
jgi:hypothetical protein